MAFNQRAMGFSAHMGGPYDLEDNDEKPSTTKLIEKFMNMYQELEARLERGI